MTIIDRIRQANRPGPPEDSIRLRVAATSTVLVGIAACSAAGALSATVALSGAVLVIGGMAFSFATRHRPPGYVKVMAALAAIALLVWFVEKLSSGQITDITTVEDPLTVLFVGIQAVHSFHVPARRDLVFTVSGGAGLMALAAAQSVDLHFFLYAVPWLVGTLWCLFEMWRSSSGGEPFSPRRSLSSVVAVATATLAAFLLLPAPNVSVTIGFVARAGDGGPISTPGALAGDSGSPSELSKAGSPAGRSRVGGFLGFAGRLDTALRGSLGNSLVMRVRAQLPTYWIGETYDRWDGQSWIKTTSARLPLRGGSPFYVPLPNGDEFGNKQDLQTFYMANSTPNLVFHADSAHEVWFPSRSLTYGSDGTLISPIELGKSAVYTVQSYVSDPTKDQLRAAPPTTSGPSMYTELPHPYAAVSNLVASVTAGEMNTYDKVQSLIDWIGTHTRYSTDIPALPPGADAVNDFLFRTRVGFCEQISTALAVMLRTLGIPAREAVGYVPDSYNPVTDLYEVRAKDAHSWVQVWFPGYGWQSFDPTASVPAANPSPGATAIRSVGRALARIPAVPAGLGFAGAVGLVSLEKWRKRRPRTWADAVVREMERAGRCCGLTRGRSETLLEYAESLEARARPRFPWISLASQVNSTAYGGRAPDIWGQAAVLAQARQARRTTRRGRRSSRAYAADETFEQANFGV